MSAHRPSVQPEKVKDWVLFLGFVSLAAGLAVSCYIFGFGTSPSASAAGKKSPIVPVREMRQAQPSPDQAGDFVSRSNSANRDTDLPIEVKSTLSGTLQRPQ
ncbi:MAG: hypothetical protein WCO79_01455 [bacterium]